MRIASSSVVTIRQKQLLHPDCFDHHDHDKHSPNGSMV